MYLVWYIIILLLSKNNALAHWCKGIVNLPYSLET